MRDKTFIDGDTSMDDNATADQLEETISSLELQVKCKDREIADLKHMLRQRESSLSWRLSQFYGRFFRMDSPVTKALSAIFSRIVPSDGDKAIGVDRAHYLAGLSKILQEHEGKVNGIFIYPPTVDWNIPLFQRPHQLALEISKMGYLFFYSTNNSHYDRVDGFNRISDNCYVTDQYRLLIEELPRFILLLSSTNLLLTIQDLEKMNGKATVVYDYIDEISQDITGPTRLDRICERHEYMKNNADIFIATASSLFDEAKTSRSDRIYLIPNGVDFTHFYIKRDARRIPDDIRHIVAKGRPIIGYYGAISRWIDYTLIQKIATSRPDYEIVLIGVDYDGSIKGQGLDKFSNIHYLGPKDYRILPAYAVWFDVSTIPFVINKITESTSPIKLFEYMALGRPIVTTDMRECRKYRSVLIGRDHEGFLRSLDTALELRNNAEYIELLKKEAVENTWDDRASSIIKSLSPASDTLIKVEQVSLTDRW